MSGPHQAAVVDFIGDFHVRFQAADGKFFGHNFPFAAYTKRERYLAADDRLCADTAEKGGGGAESAGSSIDNMRYGCQHPPGMD